MKLRHLLLPLLLAGGPAAAAAGSDKQPVDYVDLFIGTSNSRWMLGPYAQAPFGMVQLGPDNQGDVWMGGYEYSIHNVSGFSHLHAWTMGGLMIMPTTADLAIGNPSTDSPYRGANAGYHSRILKESETASPGYYSVYLYDHAVRAELTATTRCGVHRYTFPERNESRILIDLLFPTEWDYGFRVRDARIARVSDTELEGYADCQSVRGAGGTNTGCTSSSASVVPSDGSTAGTRGASRRTSAKSQGRATREPTPSSPRLKANASRYARGSRW